jgi:tRNA(Ile)-lysidine synthase
MEDSSNAKTNYKRNYLRHRILPLLESLNPSFREIMSRNIEHLKQSGNMLDYYYTELTEQIVSEQGSDKKINLYKLRMLPEPGWFLHKLLANDGFTSSQVNDILESIEAEPGRMFYSKSHKLLKDRDCLIIRKYDENDPREFYIDNWSGSIVYPIDLIWETVDHGNFRIDPDPSAACLDASLLKLPLRIRKWKPADFFYPLGMKKKKKLSDFFIDNKFSLIEKENTWLLISGQDIVWIIGHRIDNRYRVNKQTKRILCMKTAG